MSAVKMVWCKSPVADNGRDPRELVRNGWARSGHFAGKEASQARRAMFRIIAIVHYSSPIFFIYQYMQYMCVYPPPF